MGKTSPARPRRVRFAQELFAGCEQQEAARRAGYRDGPGIRVVASRLLRHPEVVEELERLRAAGGTKAQATLDEALTALSEILRADLGPYMVFEPNGQYSHLDVARLKADGKTHLLLNLDVDRNETHVGEIRTVDVRTKVRLYDKLGAVDRLAKLLGWNAAERVDVKHHFDPRELTDEELRAKAKALLEE